MGLFDNGMKMGTGVAIGVGIGAILLAPALLPVVAAVAKPLAKAAIKSGMILFERGREIVAETAEVIEDLAAEAKVEIASEHSAATVATPSAPEPGTPANTVS